MIRLKHILIIITLVVIIFFLFIPTKSKQFIIVGASNPGKILLYSNESGRYVRDEIDTNFKLIHTVRVGNILNNGRNLIVAGLGNSFFGPPFGCRLSYFDKQDGKWIEHIIDDNVDLRCKDVTVGDADNDGKNEIILGTHGEGVINIYKWNGKNWKKQEIERNFIKQIDEKEGTNHRIQREKITYDAVVQTAVHIVKIGDADYDEKNEIIATISSPLEYAEGPQITFVNIYKFDGKKWGRITVHEGKGFQHRSSLIEDVDYDGKNELLIGAAPSRLFMLKYNENWSSTLIYNETIDKNMKGLDFQDVYSKGRKVIVLATGVPNTLIYTLEWNGKEFEKRFIGNISQVFEKYNVIKDLKYNALEVQAKDIDNDGKLEIIVAGEADTSVSLDQIKPKDNIFGWEATPYGFLVVYKYDGKKWIPNILEGYSILGMDVGSLLSIS